MIVVIMYAPRANAMDLLRSIAEGISTQMVLVSGPTEA